MDRTAEQIRKAFKNTTPNVLDRVLSQGQHEKGVVIPMKEKKIVIPPALKKIASAAALLALVLFAGYIGGITATAHYLANVPTETPTEPVVIPEGPASEEKAIAYMKQHVKNPDRYTLVEYKYQEDTYVYKAFFAYLLNGVPTGDVCHIHMRANGDLITCIVPEEGAFDNIQVTDEMLQKAEEDLYTLHSLSKEIHSIEEKYIVWSNGVLSVQFSVFFKSNDGVTHMLKIYTVPLS